MTVTDLAAIRAQFTEECPSCGAFGRYPGICHECVDRQSRRAHAIRAGVATIPPRYRWATFEAPELALRVPAWAVTAAREAVPSQANLVLLGASGSGKTSLAAAVMRAWMEHTGDTAFFVTAVAIARARAEHPLGHGDAPEIRRAVAVRLLVLDELGSERQDVGGPVWQVLFERHEAGQRTVLTTWRTLDDVAKHYGGGIARRVFEDSLVVDLDEGAGGR